MAGQTWDGACLRVARRHRQKPAVYQDFLTLWKDADPDIPILIAAKTEYAKLKSLSDSLQKIGSKA